MPGDHGTHHADKFGRFRNAAGAADQPTDELPVTLDFLRACPGSLAEIAERSGHQAD